MNHKLYEDGDSNIPKAICDSNGQVCLALCKVCGQGEGDLKINCPGDKTCGK